jgi:phosphate transport system protein
MAIGSQHIVKSYDEELHRLKRVIAQMGGLAESQLDHAVDALARRDNELAEEVVRGDARIDALEQEVDAQVVRLLALRQPMAQDLREVVGSLKISSDIERIGDYAANIGKRAIAVAQMPPVKPLHAIPRMSRLAQGIIKDVLDAYVDRDVDKAVAAWARDEEVDEMYTSLFRELLTYMMEDPRNISACTHLLFVAKNIERIGDHATNIAETVYFVVNARPLQGDRPKGDNTSFAVMAPETPGTGPDPATGPQ